MATNSGVPSWVKLTPDERVIWNGRRSLRSFGFQIVVGLIIVVIGLVAVLLFTGILRLLALVPIAAGLLVLLTTTLNYWSVQYVLTTEEIYRKSGLLSRSVINLRLDRIQNTSYSQSFLERVLSYGTISIDTAGTSGTELVLHDVPRPGHVNGLLTQQLDDISPQPQGQPT